MRNGVWRIDERGANADDGRVVWAPFKSLWNTAMYAIAVVLGPLYFSWSALAVFLGLSYSTLLLGHSLGMHRRLIHRSFECRFRFTSPPAFAIEPDFAADPWYRFMEASRSGPLKLMSQRIAKYARTSSSMAS